MAVVLGIETDIVGNSRWHIAQSCGTDLCSTTIMSVLGAPASLTGLQPQADQ